MRAIWDIRDIFASLEISPEVFIPVISIINPAVSFIDFDSPFP